jgi:predicted esterase YcpF (UPF0227 family)
MKIFFLHGLESTHQSSKVDHMRALGHNVHAEYMDYRNVLDIYAKTLNSIIDFNPDLIVGSSMGGYFAYHLGTHFSTNLLLLNPALPKRSFEPPIMADGKQKSRIWAMVGENDTDVPAKENIEILNRAGAKVQIGNHKHRTPVEVFEPYFKSVLDDIQKKIN